MAQQVKVLGAKPPNLNPIRTQPVEGLEDSCVGIVGPQLGSIRRVWHCWRRRLPGVRLCGFSTSCLQFLCKLSWSCCCLYSTVTLDSHQRKAFLSKLPWWQTSKVTKTAEANQLLQVVLTATCAQWHSPSSQQAKKCNNKSAKKCNNNKLDITFLVSLLI